KRIKTLIFIPKIFTIIFDYLQKSVKTLTIIFKSKSDLIIFENPPPISAVLGLTIKKINNKFKYIIDSHNGAFEPPMINFPFIYKAFNNADAVIVHNNPLKNFLKSKKEFNQCKFFTLNDPIPEIPKYPVSDKTNPYLLVVTTFHGDEPIETVLEGIEYFINNRHDLNIEFHITGNYKKNLKVYERFHKFNKIKFLGFVDQETYHKELVNSFGVLSYSTRDMVQQFALMEALGAKKAFISNRNLTNLELFQDKMVLTEINPESIYKGIEEFLFRKNELEKNINYLKEKLTKIRNEDFDNLIDYLRNTGPEL
ncbi:MAG: hypothetical protein ACK4UV_08930, partial [Ignavibacterium sp.]